MIKNIKGPLFAEERQAEIIHLLKKNGKLLIPSLCDSFSVSPATIRNDLNDLERRGLLVRTHGGAIPVSKTGLELKTNEKQIKSLEEKRAIAMAAAEYVEDGDTISIDSGTTVLEFADVIASKKNLNVVTYDIRVASLLEERSNAQIILLGGVVRRGFSCTVGPMVTACLNQLRVDKCFLGTNSISAETGLSTPDLGQAAIKQQLINTAKRTFVLCESNKIGRDSFAAVAPLSSVEAIFTDSNVDDIEVEELKSTGVDVIIANLNNSN